MSETTGTTYTPTERRDDRRSRTPSRPTIWVSEMTYSVLIVVAAALLAGVFSLPFTMPGRAFSEPSTALGAAEFGLPASVRTAARLT
jgi:hypothetical protein